MFDFDRSLILVFGAQGSGTTWLQQMLASHSLIAAGQESQLFSGYLGPWWQRWQDEQRLQTDGNRTSGLGCYLNEEELLEEMRILTRRILGRVRYLKPAAELIVETTPDHGLQLPLIHALFPDATIIHVAREGQDQSVEEIRRDAKLFRRRHEIRYENLKDHDSKCLAEVFAFLGLPLSQADASAISERGQFANHKAISVPEPKDLALPAVSTQGKMVSIASRDDAIFRHPKSLEVVSSTNAQMLPRERLYLYATVFALAPERCLEIGVCEGGSSRIINAALEDLGKGSLTSVDPCLQISDAFRERLKKRVTFIEGASPDILAEAQQNAGGLFEFVLVDGDHSQLGVLQDLRGVVEVTAPGAIILAHDAYCEPVAAGIDEGLRSGLPFMDGGIVSSTCHPMQQDEQLYNWGGFRLLVRTEVSSALSTDCSAQQARQEQQEQQAQQKQQEQQAQPANI
jgi:predicted O-methyltransferase YrrM